ncbi:MAG: hypothetical protein ABFC96_09500 [Thermoguttaceae bacterium]
MWRWFVAAILVGGVGPALADESYPSTGAPEPAFPASSRLGATDYAASPYGLASPAGVAGDQWLSPATATPAATPLPDRSLTPRATPPTNVAAGRPIESTWYFREDSFSWNERLDGRDFVNEYGPLSTLGYLHRSGVERFRIELFGGTVAYDGGAMYDDGSFEPYHQSNGTDYLGLRGEYDLLIEPDAWSHIRLLVGIGTRFWFRNLENAVTPSGADVLGYQETWWTFYPYLGIETKDSPEPGWKFFAAARIGATPITYQYATYFDSVTWPRCGLTGRLELGVRYERFSLSAVGEGMSWAESAPVEGSQGYTSLQPASRMWTLGGQLGWTF